MNASAQSSRRQLRFDITRQPDETTCGPTSLHAVYRYFGEEVSLDQVIAEVPHLEEGGTLAVLLGCHALGRGYRATLYSYNLRVFDPTWFGLDRARLKQRLGRFFEHQTDRKPRLAAAAYLEFIERGGELRFADLSPRLIHRLLDRELPVLTGLSSTYLYRTAREVGATGEHDDVRGEPIGHFVVLCGYDERARKVLVADPLHPNPLAETRIYPVSVDRLTTAILLGVLTYDANLLQLEPVGRQRGGRA